jgi:transcription-repair coupling factor (superfamily II helicase)
LNLEDLLKKYKEDPRVNELADAQMDFKFKRIHLRGLVGSSAAMWVISVFEKYQTMMVVVLDDREEASYFRDDLENLMDAEVLLFPSSFKKGFNFYGHDSDAILRRAETLNKISKNPSKGRIIVTWPEALAEKVTSHATFEENTFEVKLGMQLDTEFMAQLLTEYNFKHTDFVYEPGQFSIRGGIIDIFSYSHEMPYRIEFLGDEVESVRTFDPMTQLSEKNYDNFTILPNVSEQEGVEQKLDLFSFFPKDTILWVNDLRLCIDVVKKGLRAALKSYQEYKADTTITNEVFPFEHYFLSEKAAVISLESPKTVEFGKQFYHSPDKEFGLTMSPQPSFNKNFEILIDDLQKNQKAGKDNFIFAGSPKQIERLYSIFEDISGKKEEESPSFFPIGKSITKGFVDKEINVACYTDHQIFDRFYKYKVRKEFSQNKALTLRELRELKPGDFVTHIDHGIGKYAGLQKIEVNGKVQESIRLVYRDNDILYVNINALGRVSKFTGKEGTQPKLSKLGSDAWEKLKKKTKSKVKDIARDLIKLYAQRKAQSGNAFSPDTYLQAELEASFMYEETPDQLKATEEIKVDMESPHPMDRLVCGDVGFGKTEVAIRAAFKAVADSKQVAILAPTTILSYQHYITFKERFDQLPCRVDYVNRFKSAKQVKETLADLKDGKIDILIGTHRIVSKDVIFKDIGLLIIDEEQKFGVATKEKLRALRANIDTLTLTATPIPRTLHFSLMGARDLSVINTPPPNRQPINTELHVFSEKLITEVIQFELNRGGQVFFVHNRIKDIYLIAELIRKNNPDANVDVGHGQMAGHELENVMMRFVRGETDILVSTTIVESGIDISNANTMIINHANNFGLSDLHQLRGRVGRSSKKGFCYLLSPPLSTLTPEARRRLSAIEEFSDLGSGFNIAMRDLDIRGAGNLLGGEQSGFVTEIGYEMYHKILDEAIQELKEDEFKGLFKDEEKRAFVSDCQIDTDFEIHIPDNYVNSTTERLNLYTELNNLKKEEDLHTFGFKLKDRFGTIPRPVLDLFDLVRIQWFAEGLGFEKVKISNGKMICFFVSNPISKYYESPIFQNVLNYVQQNPVVCRMKEGKQRLTLSFDNIQDIGSALSRFRSMGESTGK